MILKLYDYSAKSSLHLSTLSNDAASSASIYGAIHRQHLIKMPVCFVPECHHSNKMGYSFCTKDTKGHVSERDPSSRQCQSQISRHSQLKNVFILSIHSMLTDGYVIYNK